VLRTCSASNRTFLPSLSSNETGLNHATTFINPYQPLADATSIEVDLYDVNEIAQEDDVNADDVNVYGIIGIVSP